MRRWHYCINAFSRSLRIRSGPQPTVSRWQNVHSGLHVYGRQYLITAKHIVAGLRVEDSIDRFKTGLVTAEHIVTKKGEFQPATGRAMCGIR
jgi:hypothetical protein